MALVIVAVTGAWTAPAHAATKPKLWAYGDSLTWESAKASKHATKGFSQKYRAVAGKAACDELELLRADLAANPKHPPNDVTVELAGNSFTPCMNDPATGQPYPTGSPGMLAKYASDIAALAATVASVHARLLFIAPPAMSSSALNAVEDQIVADEVATGDPVTHAPAEAIAPGGVFTLTLPCLPAELKSRRKGCANGRVAVRNPSDGVHMCPIAFDFTGKNACDVYSSGELRWGDAYGAAVMAAFS